MPHFKELGVNQSIRMAQQTSKAHVPNANPRYGVYTIHGSTFIERVTIPIGKAALVLCQFLYDERKVLKLADCSIRVYSINSYDALIVGLAILKCLAIMP